MAEEHRVLIDGEIRKIYFQFSFSNRSSVPQPLRRLPDESKGDHLSRKSVITDSLQVIEPTDKTSFHGFLKSLESEGFVLVDGCFQHRWKESGVYYMVRFVFARSEVATVHPEFARIRGAARINIIRLFANAFWRIRGYRNRLPDGTMLSFNFEHRVPVVNNDGEEVKEWRKDVNGKRVGDGPIPIWPSYKASIRGGALRLRPFLVHEHQD